MSSLPTKLNCAASTRPRISTPRLRCHSIIRISAAGSEHVTLLLSNARTKQAIDAAYHAKYDRYGPAIVGTVVGAQAVPTTIRLVPQEGE